jgi:hypothetical protein
VLRNSNPKAESVPKVPAPSRTIVASTSCHAMSTGILFRDGPGCSLHTLASDGQATSDTEDRRVGVTDIDGEMCRTYQIAGLLGASFLLTRR